MKNVSLREKMKKMKNTAMNPSKSMDSKHMDPSKSMDSKAMESSESMESEAKEHKYDRDEGEYVLKRDPAALKKGVTQRMTMPEIKVPLRSKSDMALKDKVRTIKKKIKKSEK